LCYTTLRYEPLPLLRLLQTDPDFENQWFAVCVSCLFWWRVRNRRGTGRTRRITPADVYMHAHTRIYQVCVALLIFNRGHEGGGVRWLPGEERGDSLEMSWRDSKYHSLAEKSFPSRPKPHRPTPVCLWGKGESHGHLDGRTSTKE
jgi:hypothetical protein